jgi:lysophospholipase L1-like esterase
MKKFFRVIIWNLGILLILLVFVEIILSKQGYKPGQIDRNPAFFNDVDTLRLLKGFTTDSLGIQKIDVSVRKYMLNNKNNDAFQHPHDLDEQVYYIPLYNLLSDHVNIRIGEINNDFSNFISSIKQKDSLSEIDKAYIDYSYCPINTDGFKSIKFKNYTTNKKKVLLLGDSFTWGHSSINKTDGFADLLMTKDHVIFNTGITATDIPQYLAIAHHYIEILQPDIVIANIFLGNDIVRYHREVRQDIPIFYCTNAGFLNSCSTGLYFPSADSIYKHTIRLASIPQTSTFNRLMSKTRTTTLTWGVLAKQHHITGIGPWPTEYSTNFWNNVQDLQDSVGYGINKKYLEEIDSICASNSAKFITSLLPEETNFNINKEDIDTLLGGYQKYDIIRGLEDIDYKKDDGHFNEKGHQKYAEYLDSLIQIIPKKYLKN